jgi:hypothetical protein
MARVLRGSFCLEAPRFFRWGRVAAGEDQGGFGKCSATSSWGLATRRRSTCPSPLLRALHSSTLAVGWKHDADAPGPFFVRHLPEASASVVILAVRLGAVPRFMQLAARG